MSKQSDEGVTLPEGFTGSSFFRHILEEAMQRYPNDFKDIKLPSRKDFKKSYGETVVRFEAARVNSKLRSEIAKYMVRRTQDQLQYKSPIFTGPFTQYMAGNSKPSPLETIDLGESEGFKPEVPFRGQRYEGARLKDLAELMLQEHQITKAAAKAITWISREALNDDGCINLKGQKFVILGASAELAPTAMLLKAGASVLWVDIQDCKSFVDRHKGLSGTLYFGEKARNILLEPQTIGSTIEAFADGEPVHIGMFAYAAGASQEWRLTATMNGIVRSLEPSIVGSVSMLVSPTSPAVMQPEDLDRAKTMHRSPPAWQGVLKTLGLLNLENQFEKEGLPVARAIVPLQGVGYQAAQYISKTLAAEVFATQGVSLDGDAKPLRVSANVAGITKTRSLQHPVFQAAFLGAKTFGVEIFEVQTTQALSGLLLLYDLLNQDHKVQDDPQQLFAEQVHGGIYSRAFALDPMIRIATVMGLAQKPRLLLKILS
ncbi:hypothetical protein [Pseudobacteriovorax antillogorgiicola]|uniref:Uncharacterized protein n=1 Tax=Pseudobacteriovorax antillogorgiicola TaxID=1513793 RepID=A0A1Y6BUA3_9BACT|nr:hypothetical protein [Pseudobacteriovorax antillogorgiicola]TCS52388.1 hypothetical protein EDD56_109133 [Pseudobacteriovorax antillogorgiicola]SMF29161.1 hypothetical protein SAMN06296036_10980 [Pseudobacteriovorax antillogorgiicola]